MLNGMNKEREGADRMTASEVALKNVSVILDTIEGLVQNQETLTKKIEELTYQLNRQTGLNKNARLFLERAEAENAELKREIAGYEMVVDGNRDAFDLKVRQIKKLEKEAAEMREVIAGLNNTSEVVRWQQGFGTAELARLEALAKIQLLDETVTKLKAENADLLARAERAEWTIAHDYWPEA